MDQSILWRNGAVEHRGIDSCGEAGEFHTIVIDGPIFKNKIDVEFGEILIDKEYAFLDCTEYIKK